jgi:3D (Asp-Asp-Asp) domain-containing protein
MPSIARSLWRKLFATLIAMLAFVLLYEASIRDSKAAREAAIHDPTAPVAGSRLQFTATAYCTGTTTASGVNVRTGIAAADDGLLPVGSVISVATSQTKYNGIYTIMDTGEKVQGRILDLYMRNCGEAKTFGRREAQITVLRLGWNPRDSTPSLIQTLFRRRERATVLPAPPARALESMPAVNPVNEPAPSDAPAAPPIEATSAATSTEPQERPQPTAR